MSKVSRLTNPALKSLKPLVGPWEMEIRWSEETHKLIGGPLTVRGTVEFEVIGGGGFLVLRMGADAHWIMGRDDTSRQYRVLYADSRGVSRIYEMSLNGGLWKMWRKAPGFHQRFTGRFSRNKRMIIARWEKSANGSKWQLDFNVKYTKKPLKR